MCSVVDIIRHEETASKHVLRGSCKNGLQLAYQLLVTGESKCFVGGRRQIDGASHRRRGPFGAAIE
jgi:hypothetical protein